MKYKANWITTKHGNSIKSGTDLIVDISQSIVVSGWIGKKKFFPNILQVGQGKDSIAFKLKPASTFTQGKYELRLRAYDKNYRGYGWKDIFQVV